MPNISERSLAKRQVASLTRDDVPRDQAHFDVLSWRPPLGHPINHIERAATDVAHRPADMRDVRSVSELCKTRDFRMTGVVCRMMRRLLRLRTVSADLSRFNR